MSQSPKMAPEPPGADSKAQQTGAESAHNFVPAEEILSVASPSLVSVKTQEDSLTPKLGSRKSSIIYYKTPMQTPVPSIAYPASNEADTYTPHANQAKPQPLPLPRPRHPSKCPLFCCFYAEFDNKVGPKVCFETPRGFMEQEIDLPVERVHDILFDTFAEIRGSENTNKPRRAPTVIDSDLSLDRDTIFDSCSEFIITGKELTDNIINLSTHNIHVVTRPTLITDERYERNSLLFCVGFVLRRTEDPRPFRPLLSSLAITLRDMEIEKQFLSSPSTRPEIQSHLERILVSLNSSKWECNIMLNDANFLHLKLFHPPKMPPIPVPEYAVPILLRRDRQVHLYDWDLSINWVSLHIDGVTNARQISKKAEVDMEMVLSCLRVLRHHGVIALVDMFFFTNRYESTPKAAELLAGKDPKLLQAAVEFTAHGFTNPSNSLHMSELSPSLHSVSPSAEHSRTFESSYRAVASLASNNSNTELQSPRGEDLSQVKRAIMELLSCCNRSESIGDLWIRLLSGNRQATGQDGLTIDWKKMFTMVDHRRFTSFALVHGLLRRIHSYPYIVDGALTSDEKKILASADTEHTTNVASRGDRDRSRSGNKAQSAPAVDTQKLALKVASLMDGLHCDDELVCTFEKPLEELLELVKGKHIVSNFAPGAHY